MAKTDLFRKTLRFWEKYFIALKWNKLGQNISLGKSVDFLTLNRSHGIKQIGTD